MIVTIVVAILNFLGSLLPELPTLYNELAGHDDLTPEGKNALDLIAADLDAADKRIQAIKPLPLPAAQLAVPEPGPTAPSAPVSTSLAASPLPTPPAPAPTPPAAAAPTPAAAVPPPVDPANEVA